MFELPECTVLSKQISTELGGKTVARGSLGNSPHKFVWYNRTHEEFARLSCGKRIGAARVRGRWIFLPLEPGYILVLGECGGRMLLHQPGSTAPDKYHLRLDLEDGSLFTVTTQMWGAMELYEKGKELERDYIKGMRPTPAEQSFTFDYFTDLIDSLDAGEKRSVKGLLTQDQLIPGLGNAGAQDIMFRARLHPRHPVGELEELQRRKLYDSILSTVHDIIEKGGRYDELDLYGKRGGYVRVMDSKAVGRPCPVCGHEVEKIAYLGGSCYLCPVCQQ